MFTFFSPETDGVAESFTVFVLLVVAAFELATAVSDLESATSDCFTVLEFPAMECSEFSLKSADTPVELCLVLCFTLSTASSFALRSAWSEASFTACFPSAYSLLRCDSIGCDSIAKACSTLWLSKLHSSCGSVRCPPANKISPLPITASVIAVPVHTRFIFRIVPYSTWISRILSRLKTPSQLNRASLFNSR
ncbi:hypothetical protein C1A50_3511 [Paenibacillus polymyxa]|nr:hypothetical protein C1A50_3511 [Paenibacillus polymyxa]